MTGTRAGSGSPFRAFGIGGHISGFFVARNGSPDMGPASRREDGEDGDDKDEDDDEKDDEDEGGIRGHISGLF